MVVIHLMYSCLVVLDSGSATIIHLITFHFWYTAVSLLHALFFSHSTMNSAVVALKRALRKDIKAQLRSVTPATLAAECKETSKKTPCQEYSPIACSTTGR